MLARGSRRRRADAAAGRRRSRTTSDLDIPRARDSASISATTGSGRRTVRVFMAAGLYYVSASHARRRVPVLVRSCIDADEAPPAALSTPSVTMRSPIGPRPARTQRRCRRSSSASPRVAIAVLLRDLGRLAPRAKLDRGTFLDDPEPILPGPGAYTEREGDVGRDRASPDRRTGEDRREEHDRAGRPGFTFVQLTICILAPSFPLGRPCGAVRLPDVRCSVRNPRHHAAPRRVGARRCQLACTPAGNRR